LCGFFRAEKRRLTKKERVKMDAVLEPRHERMECATQTHEAARLDALEATVRATFETLERIELAIANIDARISVNEELARRSVVLTGHVAPETIPVAPGERVVTVRLGTESVSLLANSHTFDMRAELKRARASWQAEPPARWCVPRAAWDQSCDAWRTQFGVTFTIEDPTGAVSTAPAPAVPVSAPAASIDTHSVSMFTDYGVI
jgi:hypothetical protein